MRIVHIALTCTNFVNGGSPQHMIGLIAFDKLCDNEFMHGSLAQVFESTGGKFTRHKFNPALSTYMAKPSVRMELLR